MRHLLVGVAVLVGLVQNGSTAEVIFDSAGFESEVSGQPPSGWMPFRNSSPLVNVAERGAGGSKLCIRGVRSNSGGLTALSRSFNEPRQRVMIEFSFAFFANAGRSLNVWTHEPGGKDASQLNLCIQNGALMQYDGRVGAWEEITRRIVPTSDPGNPVWHRLRAIVDAEAGGIDYWVSKPNSLDLPDQPVTRHGYRTKLPIGAIDLVSGHRIAQDAWYLIDDLIIKAGKDLPAPHQVAPLPDPFPLWSGPSIPSDPKQLPIPTGIEHRTIHRATRDGYKFLHGAAIVDHNGVMFANWANSPTNENGPHETLQGRRSTDGGKHGPISK